ncbi:MAG: hypothetical protein ACXAEF_05385 [Candidatus Thorarchaeota archaeon]|jgi:hypothetical protein
MGCQAEGAAKGYTALGGIVLFLLGIQMLLAGINGAIGGDLNSLIDTILALVLILMVILAFDAAGFLHWKLHRSGIALAIFGLFSIFIVVRNITFDILGWLTNIGTLAGLMIFLGGLLLILRR